MTNDKWIARYSLAISSIRGHPHRSPDSQDLMIRKSLAYRRARRQARLLVSQAVCHSVLSLRRHIVPIVTPLPPAICQLDQREYNGFQLRVQERRAYGAP